MARMETARYYSNADIKRIEENAVRKYRKERRETFFLGLVLFGLFVLLLICCAKVLMYGY